MSKKKQKTADSQSMSEAEVFRMKAPNYLVCFMDTCPLHSQCLRWHVGQYADPHLTSYTAVNPRNASMGNAECPMFRDKTPMVMKRGLTQMYHEMPQYKAYNIRHRLFALFGHKPYYEMRNGTRLISPDQQQLIEQVCRENGWPDPVVYDGEQEGWNW